jgi:hypothetical protein
MSGYIGSTPVPQATQHRESFTATEGQTSFATAGYTPQFVDVYLNGSHLSPADFTASNGSDVVLGVAASADDVCDIVSYTPFEVADATFTGTTAVDVATVGGTLGVAGLVSPAAGITVVGSTTVDDILLTAVALPGTGNPSIALRNSDNVVYHQSGSANQIVLLDSAQNTMALFHDDAISFSIDNSTALSIDGSRDVIVATGSDFLTASAGVANVLVGPDTGASIASGGNNNVMLGDSAGKFATTAAGSVFIGAGAGLGITGTKLTGNNNIAIGINAGTKLQGGAQNNTLLGGDAGKGITTGNSNTIMGHESAPLALGANNTGIGKGCFTLLTGASNTALGTSSGIAISSGDANVMIGVNSGRAGHPGGAVSTADGQLCMGDDNITNAFIKVDWTVTSDQRDKTDFTALDLGLDFVKALNPVTFKWDSRSKYLTDDNRDTVDLNTITNDGTHKEDWTDVGFKAQEVVALEEAAGYTYGSKANLTTSLTSDGKQYGIQYSKFVPILVKAIQEQNALIVALTARVATLEG